MKETKFLGITFDSKLSFIPHLKNLRAKCLKAMNLLRPTETEEMTLQHTYQTLQMSYPFETRLRMYSVWLSEKIIRSNARPHSEPGPATLLGRVPYNPSGESAGRGKRATTVYSMQKQTCIAIRSEGAVNPSNPAFDCIFNPRYRLTFARKETAIPTVDIRVEHLVLDADIDTSDIIAPYTLPTISLDNSTACNKL